MIILEKYATLLKTPDKRLGSRSKAKKKIIKFLTKAEIKEPKEPVHPKSGILRLAIIRTAPTRYGHMVRLGEHVYVSKWSKSHTNGGTSIHSKGLVNVKKGVKTVSSWGMN